LPVSARFCSNCGAALAGTQAIPVRGLVRPREGRQIAGVCLALAQANGWDIAVVRVLAVLGLVFSGGIVGVAYLAGWIGIPEEPAEVTGAYSTNK
jgi:phage shock protein PspC (stress-responsive transcriptional regulator)